MGCDSATVLTATLRDSVLRLGLYPSLGIDPTTAPILFHRFFSEACAVDALFHLSAACSMLFIRKWSTLTLHLCANLLYVQKGDRSPLTEERRAMGEGNGTAA